jgi:predicted nucleic acid-binding protein
VSVVVDASLIVALVVADQRQAAAQAHLEGWVESGQDLHAPAVLPYEVANVLARLVFDGDLEAGGIADTWSDLAALDLVLHPFDLIRDGPAVSAITTQLRRRHATDSTYIHLAQQLDTAVWTLDGPLARNAADVGLPVKLIT